MDVLIRLRRPRAYDSRRLAVRFRTRTIQVSLHLFFYYRLRTGRDTGKDLCILKNVTHAFLGIGFSTKYGKASNCVRFYEMFL